MKTVIVWGSFFTLVVWCSSAGDLFLLSNTENGESCVSLISAIDIAEVSMPGGYMNNNC